MPTHLIRPVLVSTLVLGSFGTLTDAALAEEPRPIMVPFKCTTPWFGTVRCGDDNRNIRVGPNKRLTVDWDTPAKVQMCTTYHVIHAVSGKELETKELCNAPRADRLWANPRDESVDVYVTVGSDKTSHVTISGFYILDKP